MLQEGINLRHIPRQLHEKKLEVCRYKANFRSSVYLKKNIYKSIAKIITTITSVHNIQRMRFTSLDVQGEEHRFHRYHRCDDGGDGGDDALKALYPEPYLNL